MPRGRPTKPLALVQGHRTNAEKKVRQEAENNLLTGVKLKESAEVKANPAAHKEFMRLKKLLRSINKDDDLSGWAINTHCQLVGEIAWLEDTKRKLHVEIEQADYLFELGAERDYKAHSEAKERVMKLIMSCDSKIMQKRKMINDIGRENLLTIQSALRSIPKKPEKKESKMSALLSRQAK